MRKSHRTLKDLSIEEVQEIAILYAQSVRPITKEICDEHDITRDTLREILEKAIREELVDLDTAKRIAEVASTNAYCHVTEDQRKNACQRSWNHYGPLILERENRKRARQEALKKKKSKKSKKDSLDDDQIKMF